MFAALQSNIHGIYKRRQIHNSLKHMRSKIFFTYILTIAFLIMRHDERWWKNKCAFYFGGHPNLSFIALSLKSVFSNRIDILFSLYSGYHFENIP